MSAQIKSALMSRAETAAAAGDRFGIRTLLAWLAVELKNAAAGIDKAEVKATVLEIYDTRIAPLDIPGIPNLVEPIFDRAARRALEVGIDELFKLVA